jgi:hypothetical protein
MAKQSYNDQDLEGDVGEDTTSFVSALTPAAKPKVDTSAMLKDPAFTQATPATKQAIFDKHVGTDPAYSGANDATKAAIRQKFGIVPPDNAQDKEPKSLQRKAYEGVQKNIVEPIGKLAGPYKEGTKEEEHSKFIGGAKGASEMIPYAVGAGVGGKAADAVGKAADAYLTKEGPKALSEAMRHAAKDVALTPQQRTIMEQHADTIAAMPIKKAAVYLSNIQEHLRGVLNESLPSTPSAALKGLRTGATKGAMLPTKLTYHAAEKLIDKAAPNIDPTAKGLIAAGLTGTGHFIAGIPLSLGAAAIGGVSKATIETAKAVVQKMALDKVTKAAVIQDIQRKAERMSKQRQQFSMHDLAEAHGTTHGEEQSSLLKPRTPKF